MFIIVPAFLRERPKPRPALRALSESDAVDIWITRWLRVRRKDLILRYGCDPLRLFIIWGGKMHLASRKKALERFQSEYPSLMDRVDFGRHKSSLRSHDNPDQLFYLPRIETSSSGRWLAVGVELALSNTLYAG